MSEDSLSYIPKLSQKERLLRMYLEEHRVERNHARKEMGLVLRKSDLHQIDEWMFRLLYPVVERWAGYLHMCIISTTPHQSAQVGPTSDTMLMSSWVAADILFLVITTENFIVEVLDVRDIISFMEQRKYNLDGPA